MKINSHILSTLKESNIIYHPILINNERPFLQGAVENLLERSVSVQLFDGSIIRLDEHTKALILEHLHEMTSTSLRCLGFAYKEDLGEFSTYDGEDHPAHKLLLDPFNYSSIESDLIFAGFVGLRVSLYTFLIFW